MTEERFKGFPDPNKPPIKGKKVVKAVKIKQPKKHAYGAIVMLIFSGMLMGGGIAVNFVIDDTVNHSVDRALLQIEEQGVPLVAEMVKEKGIPEALRGIRDTGVPIVKEMVLQIGGAEVLNQIREAAIPVVEDMVLQMGVAEVLTQINETAVPIVVDMVKQIGVAEVLSQINETAVPIVMEMVKQLGVAEVLTQINETAVPIVIDMVKQIGVAEVLNQIRDKAMPFVQEIVNASFLTQLLYNAYLEGEEQSQMGVSGGDCLLNMFFDYEEIDLGLIGGGVKSFSSELENAGLPGLLGVSQWYGDDLEIGSYSLSLGLLPSPDPPEELAWGDGPDVAGVMEDTEVGTGVLAYLENYDAAVGNTGLQNAMCSDYGIDSSEFWKLGVFTDYIREYWIPVAIPTLVAELADPESETSARMPDYVGMDAQDIAYFSFLTQWADCSQFEGGMDFHEVVEEFPVGTYGFEVNRPDPTGIIIDTCYDLWDETNDLALLSMDGMEVWYEANTSTDAQQTLLDEFTALTQGQMDLILEWLWYGENSFSNFLVPLLLESSEGYDMPIEDFAQILFFEIWANGTAFGEVMYPGGMDFGEMVEGIPIGSTGFEVGVPTPTGMTADQVANLWDASNPYSLFTMDGMEYWVEAYVNDSVKDDLIAEFGITETQMDMILAWLWEGEDCFSQGLLPVLLESEFGYDMSIEAFAQLLFMEIWANGTAFGEVMYPGGMDFGDMVEGLPEGTIGFEVGVPVATGLTGAQCTMLWDPSNPYSLFSMDGMNYWVEAYINDSVKDDLIAEFGITETQMDMILAWLWEGEDCFSQGLLPVLLESDFGYGMSIEDFAQILFMEIWANGTAFGEVMYPGGMDFGDMVEGIPKGSVGFEVGVPAPTGLTATEVCALWDANNPYSLFNMDGIAYWVEANENDTVKAMLIAEFGITETQVNMILAWLWEGEDCFSKGLVPILVESDFGYGMTVTELSALLFMEQWANGTILGEVMYEGGLDFGEMVEGMPANTKGFEVGVPIPTNLSGDICAALWDETNSSSLFNMDGMALWYEANSTAETKDSLMNLFGLTEVQINMILAWLWDGEECFSLYLVPILIESDYGYGMPMDEFALSLLCSQWANGTILGDVMYPGGIDFSEMKESITETLIGFEVGVPEATGITWASAKELFNDENEKSLMNDEGIDYWIDAHDDDDEKDDLAAEFGLTDKQMDMILDWLFERSFKEDIVPELMKLPVEEGGRGMNLEELSRKILLEQWCNGTADGREEYPYGFALPLSFGEVYGFELGYRGENEKIKPAELSYKQVDGLWDKDKDTSLTNAEGLNKWWEAVNDPKGSTAKELKKTHNLEDWQMEMILDWLPRFCDEVMPFLAQEDMGLPTDSTTLSNMITMGGLLVGGFCVGVSAVGFRKHKSLVMKKELGILGPKKKKKGYSPPKKKFPSQSPKDVEITEKEIDISKVKMQEIVKPSKDALVYDDKQKKLVHPKESTVPMPTEAAFEEDWDQYMGNLDSEIAKKAGKNIKFEKDFEFDD